MGGSCVITLDSINNTLGYKLIEDNIYADLNDCSGFSTYRMAVSICLNGGMTPLSVERQLEDLLVFIDKKQIGKKCDEVSYILGGDLEDLRNFASNFIGAERFIL